MNNDLKDLLQTCRACVFDFDGTVADTEGFHFELYQRILKRRYGLSLDWTHWLHYIGRTDPDFHRMMETDYGVTIDSQSVMEEYFAALAVEEPEAVQPYPWVRDVLETCRKRGIPACVLSSGNRDVICACLKAWDLDRYFDGRNVISVSAGIFTKQDVFAEPSRYLTGFEGLSAEILLFEDSIHTIEKAQVCGVGAVVGVVHEYNAGIERYCDTVLRTPAVREGDRAWTSEK